MRRREFIAGLGGAAALPLAARAQQSAAQPIIGFLRSSPFESNPRTAAAFQRGLRETGYVDGQNVAIEYRYADNQFDRLPALAADLVRRQVDVIFAGGPPAALAAKSATTTIPVVFTSGDDPVKAGLVSSLDKPGGNVTGVNIFLQVLGAKRLGLLREFVPNASVIGVLHYPNARDSEEQLNDIRTAAQAVNQRILVVNVDSEQDIHAAFRTLVQTRAGALLFVTHPFLTSRKEQIITLAAHYAIPAIYTVREEAVAGGLMSYGTNLNDAYRLAGLYAGRILKGEKPSELPVMQSTRFEFVVNLKTAKTLGLEFPQGLVLAADEVIE
jgi:putative ABC transport system substrate-binding protein